MTLPPLKRSKVFLPPMSAELNRMALDKARAALRAAGWETNRDGKWIPTGGARRPKTDSIEVWKACLELMDEQAVREWMDR